MSRSSPSSCSPLTDAAAFHAAPEFADDYSPEVVPADHARKLEHALRILYGDVNSLGHWLPDPCRRLVDDALANN